MLAKRRNTTKKNKLEEVVKPRGFERGLTLEKIVGVTNCKNELMFLLQWKDCMEYDLVKASEVNEKCPDVVIEYYESRCPINQKFENNLKLQEKYEEEVTANPPPEAAESKMKTDSSESKPEASFLGASDKTTAESDVVNAAFSINVDDTNSVQVSYSLPLIESQPGDELMETQGAQQSSQHTSDCHMPDLQDVEMQ
ncbi:Chromobox protein like 3 [Pseudolycoriella hygida]|uniref:Chromobox protein like 3 n=1 Tax=Pseudolycoriella hygida TaxID=35572 RepID=A0A9Q0MZ00_9DIPT|nr:Chromobox protein like 3 [Pseudolycoriella hygida]